MKKILVKIYFILSLLFFLLLLSIGFFMLVWGTSLEFDLMPVVSFKSVFSIVNTIIYILIVILDVIIYFLMLILCLFILRHSYYLIRDVKIKKLEIKFLISYFKYIILIILLDYLIKFILVYLIKYYHFSHIVFGVLVKYSV